MNHSKHPDISFTTKQDRNQRQAALYKETIKYISNHSPYYKRVFQNHKLSLAEIGKLVNLQELPLTSKDDLQRYNDDFQCVSNDQIIDYVTTSGTLGKPVSFVLTESDLSRLAYNEYSSFKIAGTDQNDIFQLMLTLDKRFMAGLAYFMGLRKIGAGIIRSGSGNIEMQLESIHRFSPTGIVAVPSFIVRFLDILSEKGIDPNSLSIKKAICIGEPIRSQDFSLNSLGRRITSQWNIDLFSTYASTEMSTAFTECEHQNGGHELPDLIITELLDDAGQAVKDGEFGEVTITTLGISGMPLIRYQTGDICKFHEATCGCGRTTRRIGPVKGRKKQMIKYKGTTLYPPAVFEVMNGIQAVSDYVIIIEKGEFDTDIIEVKCTLESESMDEKQSIMDKLQAALRVTPKVTIVQRAELVKLKYPKSSRKPLVLIDNR